MSILHFPAVQISWKSISMVIQFVLWAVKATGFKVLEVVVIGNDKLARILLPSSTGKRMAVGLSLWGNISP